LERRFKSSATERSPEVNLAWLVSVIEPDLLAERGHSSDHPAPPETELAKAMQGRVLRSVFDQEIQDASVRAIYGAMQGDEHNVDVLVESLSAEEAHQDLAKFTALTLVACGRGRRRQHASPRSQRTRPATR
jgi:hypothetical protein